MRIIYANNWFYLRGGCEKVYFDDMETLKHYGHTVVPFSKHFELNEDTEYSQYFIRKGYDGKSLSKKISEGLQVIYSSKARDNFNELVKHFNPDLIHAHNIYGGLTTSIVDVSKNNNIPVVMSLHDYKLICPSYTMLSKEKVCEKCVGGKFYNCILARCHKNRLSTSLGYTVETYFNMLFKKYNHVSYYLCPSIFLLKMMIKAGIPEEKLVHMPHAIRIEDYKPNSNNDGYILYAGRLSKEKGIITLLKAVKELDVELRIAGDGPLKEDCERYVKENNIENIIFEGYNTGDRLKNLFRNASFIIFPSECYETFGMSVLEAFAYGKPVIGADIGALPELIINNETGQLFKPGDHIELSDKISGLLSNPALIFDMGIKARRLVEKKYNADIHYYKLLSIYESTVNV